MTSPAPAAPAPWLDVVVDPCDRVPVLGPGQPHAGVLWVTAGSVEFAAGPAHGRVLKGDVVAYRLGDGLRFSAPPGTRVRWSARTVDLPPATVRAWTPSHARDLPDVPATALPGAARRRALRSVAIWLATAAVAAVLRGLWR